MEGEKESAKPRKDGRIPGEIVDTSISARLKRAIERRKVPNYRPRTHSDRYMHIGKADDKTFIPTPFDLGDVDHPYIMFRNRWGPFVNGKNRPRNSKGRPTTIYADMAEILDDWCSENADRKAQLAEEMLEFMKTGNTSRSTLFQLPDGENARRAAQYMCAILVAAEPHEARSNPDGGKLARGCLRAIKNRPELTFTQVFGKKNAWFFQALPKGNEIHREMMETGGFRPELEEELSDSSDEELLS